MKLLKSRYCRTCPACRGQKGQEVPDQGWRDKWVTCQRCGGSGIIDVRTKSEVLKQRQNAVGGGCCDRFADHQGCDCLERALPDDPAGPCRYCDGYGRVYYGGNAGNYTACQNCIAPRKEEAVKDACEACEGKGKVASHVVGGHHELAWHPCHTCQGTGKISSPNEEDQVSKDFSPARYVCTKCLREIDFVKPNSDRSRCCNARYVDEKEVPDLVTGGKLGLCQEIRHHYPEQKEQETSQVYVQQSEKNKPLCEVTVAHELASFTLAFLTAGELDVLSEFFAEAAQKLRLCTHE